MLMSVGLFILVVVFRRGKADGGNILNTNGS